jgi:hypothetical protein
MNKQRVLVIDDVRTFQFDAAYARTFTEGLRLIDSQPWDEVWLDHDLGGDDTIYPIVLAMEEAAYYGCRFHIGMVFVHTDNPVGRQNITRALERYYPLQQVFLSAEDLVANL